MRRPDTVTAFRVGIIGAGMISDIHVRGLRRIGDIEIVGIADRDLRRAERKGAEHGLRVFAGVADLLRVGRPDVVHVLTPPVTHAAICVEAMEHGAHVYVEKPMASTEADCATMIEAAARTGRELCVGHCMVHDPLMQRALRLIADGVIGDVQHATAVYSFDPARIPGYESKAWYRELGGGFVEDLASHPASLLLPVIGAPTRVIGVPGRSEDGAPADISAMIEGERAHGSIFVSLAARPEEVSLEVRGTRGTIRADFSAMAMTVQRARKLPKKLAHGVRIIETAAQLLGQTATSTIKVAAKRADATKGIHSLIAAFYDALRSGHRAPVTGEDGRHVVRVLRELWPDPVPVRPTKWVLSHATATAPRRDGSGWPRTALVTGATGFIGRHLVRRLVKEGVTVRALARNPDRARSLRHSRVEIVIGDVGAPEVTQGLAEGMDVVFHLASVMKGSWEEFERVDVEGGRRLIEEAKRAGARRFVFTSTMGAYALGGLADGAVVTEEMTDSPDRVGNYARAKLLVERMLLDATAAGELEGVVVRPGLVFGPGTRSTLEHLPHMGTLIGDRYVMFGDGRVPLQLTYVENAVEALWLSATSGDAAGQVFTIIDDDVPTQREYVARLSELTRRPYRVLAVPRPAAWMIGLGVEGLAGIARKSAPTTRRLLIGKTVKLAFDCTRAKEVLGWRPEISWEEGLQRTVEWERSRLARRS